ncbi:MAG TPA: GNAT family N-acetyltransferase [Planctomycetota bacterium]|nr:GNAT family N-acetyltransferase [Planctomycetota bacterium]
MTQKYPRVLVLHNVPRETTDQAEPAWQESDAGVMWEVEAVAGALGKLGVVHRVAGVRYLTDLPTILAGSPEEVVFNLIESFHDNPFDANSVPIVCEAFGKECTGNPTPCLLHTQDKWREKAILSGRKLPCAPGVVVPVGKTVRRSELPAGPYIVKPRACDGSEGIDADSFVKEPGPALQKAIKRVHNQFGQAALVEQFIGSREVNVAVIQEGSDVRVLAISEIDFVGYEDVGRPRIVDYAAKWHPDSFEYTHTPVLMPARLSEQEAELIRTYAITAWHTTGCRDYARVDFRLDEDGEPMILEVNANPDISVEGGYERALAYANVSYETFVETMITNAYGRLQARLETQKTVPPPPRKEPPGIIIRYSMPQDREAIIGLLADTQAFRPDELEVAGEVLDDALAHGEDGHYQSYVAEQEDGHVTGWVCFGPTPCTLGTFDVYWIAVNPNQQSKGVGTALLQHCESLIKQSGGRIAVVETSGRPSYESSRLFYTARGYQEKARLRDFYAPEDDKVIYARDLG